MRYHLALLILTTLGTAAAQFEVCEEDMLRFHESAVSGVLSREVEPPSVWKTLCYYDTTNEKMEFELQLSDPMSLRQGEDIVREFVGSGAVIEIQLSLDGWYISTELGDGSLITFGMVPLSQIPDEAYRTELESLGVIDFYALYTHSK